MVLESIVRKAGAEVDEQGLQAIARCWGACQTLQIVIMAFHGDYDHRLKF